MVNFFLPLSLIIGLIVYSLAARWYVWPYLRRQSFKEALTPLLLLHGLRYIGLAFLIPGVTDQVLNPRFANPAAYGDLTATLLALLALLGLRKNWAIARAQVWLFNVFGTADLIIAVLLGLSYTPDGHLGAAYFIPALAVPAYLVTHAMIFKLQIDEKNVPIIGRDGVSVT